MNILCSPHTDDIEKYLINKNIMQQRFLHLTPTLILYRRRLKFYASKYRTQLFSSQGSMEKLSVEEQIRRHVDLFQVNHFIKELRRKPTTKVLTKSEATVILERILKQNPSTNNPSWTSVINELFDAFAEFSLTGMEISELKSLDTSKKWIQIINIYDIYLKQLQEVGASDAAIYSYKKLMNLDVSNYSELILDGAFLPITPSLQVIINKFKQQQKPITILLPYDLDHPDHPALQAIRNVYEHLAPLSDWSNILVQKPSSFFINHLPKNIFRATKSINLDSSMSMMRFNTVEEELTFIMQKIYVLIKHKEISPRQIVIVTPGAMELRPLIREISEQYNLKVHLPRRPFMHLSQGRAIRYLFDIHTDIRKEQETYFTNKMMKVFINDSLLKHNSFLLQAFEKIECFFEDCISIKEFLSKLDDLLAAKPLLDQKHQQHPLQAINEKQLKELIQITNCVEEISTSLVHVPQRLIGEHVEALIRVLKEDPRIKEIDDEIWNRILTISDSAQNQRNISISGVEFGVRVSGLFTEQEEFEPGEHPVEDEKDIFLEKEILVTGPNNVEFQKYDYVFLCRFTQDVYPEPLRSNWVISKKIEQQILQQKTIFNVANPQILDTFYLDRSLYHLYITMCAPNTQLTISYSKMDNGQPLTPSHYLHDIARVFGLEEGDRLVNKKEPSLESLLEHHKVLKMPVRAESLRGSELVPDDPKKWDLMDTTFTAEDVAIFQYCQRRFYYQNKHTSENNYSQLFHLQSYAASCLYEEAIVIFIEGESFPVVESLDLKKQQKRLERSIISCRDQAENTIRKLFPFGNRQWHNVKAQTDFFLRTLISTVFDNAYVREYRKNGKSTIKISMSLSDRMDVISLDGFTFTSIRELEVQYNDGDIHRYSISNRKDFLSFTSKDYDEKDTMEELKQWYFNFKREFRNQTANVMSTLQEVVSTIQIGEFKKNTGGHCMYCSFNKICREREVDL